MTVFRVVQVIKDIPLPDWLPRRLQAGGIEFSEHICWNAEDLAHHAGHADVVWSYGGRPGLLVGNNLTHLGKCGAILRTGSGTDNVDIRTATELGIIVTNTPHVTVDPVADQTISMLFSLVRQVTRQDRMIRHGVWNARSAMPLRRFRGATLGLIAFGRIPQAIVRKLSGFGMSFIAYDPYVSSDVMASLGVKRVSLPELLQTADYVSVHCPLTEDTYHLLGEPEFRLMQPHAVFINTSRGAVVDELALTRALQESRIAGAALDVLEKEPPEFNNPLLTLENVILTTHNGGFSDVFPEDMCEASVEALFDLKARRWPRSVVNPEVKPRWGAMEAPGVE
jgi:D-3-phosphoglycerate dehydrogenase